MGSSVRERLEAALRGRYDDVHYDFGPVRPGRVSGIVVTSRFNNKNTQRRQDELWDLVRETLGPESTDVSTLVTLTPEEYADMTA